MKIIFKKPLLINIRPDKLTDDKESASLKKTGEKENAANCFYATFIALYINKNILK